jgi:hypothetical protein
LLIIDNDEHSLRFLNKFRSAAIFFFPFKSAADLIN